MNKEKNTPKLRFPGFTEDWEEKKLGEIADNLSYGLNSAACDYDGINGYIRITDIGTDGNYINSNQVSPEGDFSEEYMVKEGDILFARTGASTGKTYKYKESDGRLFYAGFLIRARICKDYDCGYVYYSVRTNRYNNWVKLMSMRSGQPGINAKEYSSYDLCLPSVFEQSKIANFLSTLDSRISLQSQKVKKLEKLKKGYMQKIFSQELRFKREDGSEYEEWEEKKLGEVSSRVIRKNKNKVCNRVLTISSIDGLVEQESYFIRRVASSNIEGYYLLNRGEFAYNKSYSNGYPWGSVKMLKNYEDGVLSTLYICFAIDDSIDGEFLEQYFTSTNWHDGISMIAVEGARNHGLLNVGVNDFFETIHVLPHKEEQSKIADFLSSFDKQIEMKKKELEKLQELKKGLLQQMFV